MKNKDVTKLNTIMALTLQIVTILNGFLIPRLILQTFGSEVNGLVSSLNQFLNYISLLEGGISGVIMANLYKPLHEGDKKKRDSVINTTKSFYKKISYVFIAYSIGLAIIYPLVVKTSFSFAYVSSLILILSVNLFTQYCFSLTWKNLLTADKKVYITSLIQIIFIVINAILTIIAILIYPEIHFVKLLSATAYLVQPIIYNIYINKKYDIDKEAPKDNNLIAQRWDALGINIAAFIHNNTDVTILTLFTSLPLVSIYTTYSLVTSGIKSIVQGVSSGISPSIGHALVDKDKNHLQDVFNQYEFIMFFVTCFLYTMTYLLIVPFIQIYTKGVTDANYVQPIFAAFLVLSELFYSLREPYNVVAYNANKFKDLKKYAYMEAIINIVLSLIVVKKLKIVGVVVATLIAMIYRTISQVFYLKKNVLYRSPMNFFKKLIIYGIGSVIVIIFDLLVVKFSSISISSWILKAIIDGLVLAIVYVLLSYLFYKDEFRLVIKRVLKFKN